MGDTFISACGPRPRSVLIRGLNEGLTSTEGDEAAAREGRGVKPAQVTRELGVSRQSVMRWVRALAEGGLDRLAQVGRRGGRFRLSQAQLKELAGLLKQGAIAAGYATEMWTLPRVAALIEERCGERLAISSV